MKKAFYSSLLMHILVFIFISITLPEINTKEIDYISVEIINEEVPITPKAEKLKANKEVKKIEKVKEVKEVKEVKKIIINPAPPSQKPNIIPKSNESIKITKKIDIKPKVPIKKPKIKINKNIEKKEVQVDKIKNNDEIFDDMLKNLEKIEPEFEQPQKEIETKAIIKPTRTNEEIKRIRKSIISIIYKQIKENYSMPPAPDLKVINDVTVQLRIYVRQDGIITKTIVNDKSLQKAKSDPSYLPYIEAAQRAIRKLGRFSKLPQKEYKSWKIIDINFTPYET